MAKKTEKIHIDMIMPGDTIFHDNREMTVSQKDIKRGGFMGTSIFGDCYKSGTVPVLRVIIKRALPVVME